MRKKKTAFVVALALAGSSLAACGSDEAELPKPKAGTSKAAPAVSAENLEKIQKKIFSSISKADESLNVDALGVRTIGPAAAIRGAQYKLKAILADAYELPTLSSSPSSTVVSGSGSFPRIAYSTMRPADKQTVPSIDVFMQLSARQNWALWGSMFVQGGVTVPEIKGGPSGAELLAHDHSDGLAASPSQTLAAYVQLNNTRTDSQGLAFKDDRLRKDLVAAQDENAKTVSQSGSASMTFASNADNTLGLRTKDGGAFVVGVVDYNVQLSVTQAGGKIILKGRAAEMATGQPGATLEVNGTATQSYSMLVAFHVPPANAKDKSIELVAASVPQLMSVSNG